MNGGMKNIVAFCEFYREQVNYSLRLIADGKADDCLMEGWDEDTEMVFDRRLPQPRISSSGCSGNPSCGERRVADRGGVVCSRYQPFEQTFRQRAGDKLAHGVPLADDTVDGGDLECGHEI